MWDILYAIDASSSMTGSMPSRSGSKPVQRIDSVKQAITTLPSSAGRIPRESRLAVLAYHAETKGLGIVVDKEKKQTAILLPLTPIEEIKEEVGKELQSKLDSLKTEGGTPAGVALKTGFEVLTSKAVDGIRRIKKILLVTDEYSDSGPDPATIIESISKDVIVDVIGIRNKSLRNRWEPISSKTGGAFVLADSQEDLTNALLDPRIPLPQKVSKEIESARQAFGVFIELSNQQSSTKSDPFSSQKTISKLRDARTDLSKQLLNIALRKEVLSNEIRKISNANLTMSEYAKKAWPVSSELKFLSDIEIEIRRILQTNKS